MSAVKFLSRKATRRRTAPATLFSGVTTQPTQSAAVMYGGQEANAVNYAFPGSLVLVGRDNYNFQVFKDISAAGGTVLIYIDALVDNAYGLYAGLLINSSVYGAAASLWPGPLQANQYGNVLDFRLGSVVQQKFPLILERMVEDNPHIGGFFLDDCGSRSYFPGFTWSSLTAQEQQDWRDGAIGLVQSARAVCDRHRLMQIVNGSWNGGTLAVYGGGYPDMAQHGLSLAEGGMVEHHPADAFYLNYVGSDQWASQCPLTGNTKVLYVLSDDDAGRDAFRTTGDVAYAATQAVYDYVAPWGSFHETRLPYKVPKIAIHKSSPPRVTVNDALVTTAAFDPPACVLVAAVCGDAPSGVVPAITMSNNGTALTWTQINVRTVADTGGLEGIATLFAVVLSSARTGMTVTATNTISNDLTLKLYCVTGADMTSPVGASTEGSGTANNLTTGTFNAASDGSLGFVAANDWDANGVLTSTDTVVDTYHVAGQASGASGYKFVDPVGYPAAFNLDAAGTANALWNWVSAEIKAAV